MTPPLVTDRTAGAQRAHTIKTVSVMTLLMVMAGLIAWSMWRRGMIFGQENGSAWEYAPAKVAGTSHASPAAPTTTPATVPAPGAMPDPTTAATPNLPSTQVKKPRAAIRLPLARPVPDETTAAVAPSRHKRHHRKLLGLGKLWQWIRRHHHHKRAG